MRWFRRPLLACTPVIGAVVIGAMSHQAAGQLSTLGPGASARSNQPVTFTSDQVEYDREHGLVIATGHVQAWQNDHMLSADTVTFDRNTNIATAQGHVVLVEPDGQVLFSDSAELGEGMQEAVLKGMSARLAENAKLIANGARRSDGKLNELSRAIYSTCDLCADHPERAPLWQLRASTAVQDTEHKRIEYEDVWLDVYGIPVFYFPYFWHTDPSVKRASGLLPASIGLSSHLGAFASQPFYWVLDDQSDATITPEVTTQAGEELGLNYRRYFNDGRLTVNSSLADDHGQFNGHVFANGQFDLDDNWRYGFAINRATSADYLRNYHIATGTDILSSQVYMEGFGQGSYTKLDARIYQGLTAAYNQIELPRVLPRWQYGYSGEPDAWGGRLTLDTDVFNVQRDIGTNTRRASVTGNWERPLNGQLGDLWKVTAHVDVAGYDASHLNEQPNYANLDSAGTVQAQPQVAVDYRWPLVRDSGSWGTQIIEPIAQIIVGPNTGSSHLQKVPNEDSLDLQFSDANLFGFNRFPGIDRLEGGARANVALHGAWNVQGQSIDTLIGQSYRAHKDDTFAIGSGLEGRASDVVGHISYVPSSWLDVTARARVNNQSFAPRFGDVIATGGPPILRLSAGYIYETTNPFYQFVNSPADAPAQVPRNELALSASTGAGHWHVSGYARRDLARNEMVAAGANGSYEDECTIFSVQFYRRFTSLNGDTGDTTVVFQLTLKTVGQVGFHAF